MLWSWYMANDTQFYVLGILLLLVSVRCVPVGATINEMADLIASAANINVVAIYDRQSDVQSVREYTVSGFQKRRGYK
jgi:hypothetical protein